MATFETLKDDSVNNNNNTSSFGMAKPTNENEAARLALIDDLKLFLATAADNWDNVNGMPLKRFHLPTGESISCVLWNDLYFVTGTDIVRSLTFRFHAFGRPITNAKKFEEGIFSDLRNLKPGIDARLEEPKSDLLDMLYKNNCIRTQKKQKVFFWYSVPHDRLFLDALERDLKREKMGLVPTTTAVAEPATSTSLDTTQELFDQLRKSMSISAAATAHALEEEVNATCVTLNNTLSPKTPSPTSLEKRHPILIPTSPKSNAFMNPSLAERVQTRRSRVNSVPADFGQDQDQLQQLLLQQQKQKRQHYRMSHGSYFASTSSSPSASTASPPSRTRQRNASSSSASSLYAESTPSSPSSGLAFDDLTDQSSQDTLIDGVYQMDIANRQQKPRKSAHHHHQKSHANQHHTQHHHHHHHMNHQRQQQQQERSANNGVLPSKSLDSNTLKKTKTIFGSLTLFDGSPTYKQRRRRAASVSSSVNQQQQQQHQQQHQQHPLAVGAGGGGPDRIRRHTNCHLRTSSTASVHGNINNISNNNNNNSSNAVHQPTSRLAMAAMAAGFTGRQEHPALPAPIPAPLHHHRHPYNGNINQQQQASRQRHHHGAPLFMQQQVPATSDPCSLMMNASWSGLMDTTFQALDDDSFITCSTSTSTSSHPFLNGPSPQSQQQQRQSYMCDFCGKPFQCSDSLDQHRKMHDNGLQQESFMVKDETDDDNEDYHRQNHTERSYFRPLTMQDASRLNSSTSTTSLSASAARGVNQDMYQQQYSNDFYGNVPISPSRLSINTAVSAVSATSAYTGGDGMLSPVEDMDLDIKDTSPSCGQPQRSQQSYASPGQSDHGLTPIVTAANTNLSTDFMLSYASTSMLSPEDELSSPSSSSPSSLLHYQGYYDMLSHPLSNSGGNNHDVPVLLSPFKPDVYATMPSFHHHHHHHLPLEHHHYQQPLNPGVNDTFHASSVYCTPLTTSTFCNNYQDYTPLTTNDMTMVFN